MIDSNYLSIEEQIQIMGGNSEGYKGVAVLKSGGKWYPKRLISSGRAYITDRWEFFYIGGTVSERYSSESTSTVSFDDSNAALKFAAAYILQVEKAKADKQTYDWDFKS